MRFVPPASPAAGLFVVIRTRRDRTGFDCFLEHEHEAAVATLWRALAGAGRDVGLGKSGRLTTEAKLSSEKASQENKILMKILQNSSPNPED